ncbi:MAG: glycosyltransferase family 4 protein, partial [Bacteroidales bacterium]|nr:glycosyltransferase family 4 protein [Bacteroidales bacterium]
MIIGYDAKRAYRNNSGLGNYSRLLLTTVAEVRRDWQLLLYAPRTAGHHENFYTPLKNLHPRRPKGLWRLAGWLWRSWGVARRLRRDGVDLFHGLSHELPLGIPTGVRSVVTMHDLIVWRFPEYFKPFDRLVHRLKQRHACRVADIVVAISEQTKRDLVDIMHVDERKIRVLYQSCDPIFWAETTDDERAAALRAVRDRYNLPPRYILCVGTVEPRKNQVAAVWALAQLPPDVELVIVGRHRGNYAHDIVLRTAYECRVADRVRFLTDVPFADFPALYRGAVASVYMSHFEGFGIPVLESLCCDTPV